MKIKKAQLDKLIATVKEYWEYNPESDNYKILRRIGNMRIEMDLCGEFPAMLHAIFGYQGVKKDATNEDIYKVLAILGYEVTE